MTDSPVSDRTPVAATRGRVRLLAGACVVTAAAVLTGCTGGSDDAPPIAQPTQAAPAPAPVTADPVLIKHGWDVPEPEQVRANAAAIEALPFDGVTVRLPDDLSSTVQSRTPVSVRQLRAALEPLTRAPFTERRHDFVMAYAAPTGDLFDDWSVPVQNFANLAKAARGAGLEGVFYDVEEYFGDTLRYPENCAGRSVEECQAQAQLRGRQIMDAMRDQWPDISVITTFGPWVSETDTSRNLPGVPYNDIAWANQLTGPFTLGLFESAAGSRAKVIDGGEIYTARTPEDFATVKAWIEQGMPSTSPLIPESLRAGWAATVSTAFGVYDEPWIGVDMDVDTWRTTLANALAATDEYVWAYTEKYDWLGTGWPADEVPAEWVEATRAARRG